MCPLLVTEDVYFKKSGHQPNGADLLQRFATENQPNGGHLPYFLHKMSTFNKCHNQKKYFPLKNVGTQDLGLRVLGPEAKSGKSGKCDRNECWGTSPYGYVDYLKTLLCWRYKEGENDFVWKWVGRIFLDFLGGYFLQCSQKKRLSAVECISLQVHLKEIAQRLSWGNIFSLDLTDLGGKDFNQATKWF